MNKAEMKAAIDDAARALLSGEGHQFEVLKELVLLYIEAFGESPLPAPSSAPILN
jgi:hypothetical protein